MNLYYEVCYHFLRFFGNVVFSYRVVHPERMIVKGPAILAMNHESFLDPPLAAVSCPREVYSLARKNLMDWPVLGFLFTKINVIPVDRSGGDMTALKALIRLLKKNQAVLLFPEGTRTPDGRLQPVKSGLGFLVAKTLAPVVPMRIFGAHEALPKGGKAFHASPIAIVIGEPIYFTEADLQEGGRDVYQSISDRVMNAIAALKYDPERIEEP